MAGSTVQKKTDGGMMGGASLETTPTSFRRAFAAAGDCTRISPVHAWEEGGGEEGGGGEGGGRREGGGGTRRDGL